MGKRAYKCYWCNEKSPDEEMQLILHGQQKKRYHLEGCYQEYLDDQRFKKKEKEELDSLVETIKEIHEIATFPSKFFPYLQDIRNGNELFGNIGKKKKKAGYKYSVIEATYRDIQDKIDWAKRTKDFKHTMGMLNYTKTILMNEIDRVNYEVRSKELDEEEDKAKEIDQDMDYYNDGQKYKKNDDDMDISKFL